MEFLTRILFEDLLWLVLLGLAALAIAIAIHRRKDTAGTRKAVWVTLAVCVALLAVQWLVETDREKLQNLVKGLVRAADQGDVAAIGDLVDETGVVIGRGKDAANCSKAGFVAMANVGLQEYQVDDAGAGGFEIAVNGDTATVSFRVACDLRESQESQHRTVSNWKIDCVRSPSGWRLRGIPEAKLGLSGLMAPIDIIPTLENFQRSAERGSRR